ncbi:MAG: LPP20 family lipoprotein [Motiliproteus sp.]|nr:LPP20 family lipoprotein [Motiliproteus sp.]MCW9052708.1 LPP20 family lipoprotein [Motiliproteus sp.]
MMRVLVLIFAVVVAGCDTVQYQYQQAKQQVQKANHSANSEMVVETRTVTATGYAPISLQSGVTRNQKVLNAMRASKLQAYKELAAIVHGQYLFGTTQVKDMVLQNEQFNAAVGGVIRGARVVKTFPIQEDTYATILELDMRDVQQAYVSAQPQ